MTKYMLHDCVIHLLLDDSGYTEMEGYNDVGETTAIEYIKKGTDQLYSAVTKRTSNAVTEEEEQNVIV